LHKTGNIIDLYITAVPIFFEHKVIGISGIAKDITELKKIQKQLLDSKNQLQNIFNSINICLWSKNALGSQIFQISPACQEIYGYSQSEFLKNPYLWKESIHPLGHSRIYISVNVSAKQLNEDQFIPNLISILKEIDFDPQNLKIEITESTMMKEIEKVAFKLHELDKLGIEVLLDDFGTGYSSLRYLQKLPIKTLKIDRSFIQDINNNREQEAIIKTIVAMANNLRMGIIAEGVEQKNQQLFLQELGCFNIQGYLHSRPVPFEAVIDLVKNKIKGFKF